MLINCHFERAGLPVRQVCEREIYYIITQEKDFSPDSVGIEMTVSIS